MKKIFLALLIIILAQIISFGQGASTAYIVDEGFSGTGTPVSALNAGFTITNTVSTYTTVANSEFGRNAPGAKFSISGESIEYHWTTGTTPDQVTFLYEGESGSGSTFDIQESSNGTTWTTVTGSPATTLTTAATFDGPLLSTSSYVKVTFTKNTNNAIFDDFRIRKSGAFAATTHIALQYELINSEGGTPKCGNCEGYNEFVVFKTGTDALDVHYFELVSPTMTYGAGDLAMGGDGTVSSGAGGNNNTNINWILNANLTGTQTTYNTKLNTACGCTSFVNIPASNIIPANTEVIAFTGSAPDGTYTIPSLTGKTVYVLYSNDASGCTTSGKYGNSCASNCTRYLTIFNHSDGDISNKNFTTPSSTNPGDTWDFATGALISSGCSLAILPIDLNLFSAQYNTSEKAVYINWITSTETNNKLFTIEKTRDGQNWEVVSTVPGAGTSDKELNYTAVDETPYSGESYYRLKQTDFDGNNSYPAEAAVRISNLQLNGVSVIPNPAKNISSITFNSPVTGIAKIEIYNCVGKLIDIQSMEMTPGTTTSVLNISSYVNGIYYVLINNTLQQYSSKLVVSN